MFASLVVVLLVSSRLFMLFTFDLWVCYLLLFLVGVLGLLTVVLRFYFW